MNTPAEYSTVRQLLAIHGQIAPVTETHIGAGRVHRIARPADSAPKLVSQAEYIAALSRTEWRSTAEISVALGVAPHVVKQRLMGVNMRPLVEVRTAGRGGRYEWRLK